MLDGLVRAKRLDNAEWVCGQCLQRTDNHGEIIDAFIVLDAYEQIRYGQRHIYSILGKESYRVDHQTMGYSANRTDKNGKSVFTGDILNFDGTVFVCYWDDGNLEFGLRNSKESIGMAYMAIYDAEIIGNIHDNPELLENP